MKCPNDGTEMEYILFTQEWVCTECLKWFKGGELCDTSGSGSAQIAEKKCTSGQESGIAHAVKIQ